MYGKCQAWSVESLAMHKFDSTVEPQSYIPIGNRAVRNCAHFQNQGVLGLSLVQCIF